MTKLKPIKEKLMRMAEVGEKQNEIREAKTRVRARKEREKMKAIIRELKKEAKEKGVESL